MINRGRDQRWSRGRGQRIACVGGHEVTTCRCPLLDVQPPPVHRGQRQRASRQNISDYNPLTPATIALVFFLSSFLNPAHAQPYPIPKKARDLIEKAINVHGGQAAMEKLLISTWKGRGLMYREDREPDRPVPFFAEWHAKLPTSYKYTFSLKGIGGNLPVSTAWSEGKGWRTLITGRGADDLPEKLANEEAEEAHVLYLTRLTPLLSGNYQLTVMPVAQRDNRFIIGLKVDAKGHRSCLLFFDRSTGLLTFVDRKVFDPQKKEDVSQETSYLNFKPMGGATMAQSITIKRGKKLYMELELDRIDPKDDIPKSVFEKPPEPKD